MAANFMPLLTELGVIDRAQVYKQVAPNGAFKSTSVLIGFSTTPDGFYISRQPPLE
jgi:hypothetical protein